MTNSQLILMNKEKSENVLYKINILFIVYLFRNHNLYTRSVSPLISSSHLFL